MAILNNTGCFESRILTFLFHTVFANRFWIFILKV